MKKNERLNIIPINIRSGCYLTIVCKEEDGELYLEYQDQLTLELLLPKKEEREKCLRNPLAQKFQL